MTVGFAMTEVHGFTDNTENAPYTISGASEETLTLDLFLGKEAL
jgi:hypothetical protein